MFARTRTALIALTLALTPAGLRAQQHEHRAGMHPPADSARPASAARPMLPGQDAFGAIGEIVRILRADPTTDWSTVDLEALRQHLIDMNAVTLGATVASEVVDGGLRMTVTGEGRTRDAIRRMVGAHGHVLGEQGLDAKAEEIPGGVRWTVTTRDPSRLAELRGLGFIGIMTLGEHHTLHHLQVAKGERMHGSH